MWKIYSVLLSVFLLIVKSYSTSVKEPTVEIEHGKIQGLLLKAGHDSSKEFYAFKGIPYAKPPTGKLRFKPPQDPEPWNDIKSGLEYGSHCPQKDVNTGSVIGSEDCLKINVFTPKLDADELMPVMVWFHGGAHIKGWCNELGEPDYLVVEDVVVVTLNFRTGIFGFFTTNDENSYGNLQFQDQLVALKWVQRNIEKFGGDPKKVTLFGVSSGGNAISILHLSPQTNGLFHQIIIESASSLNARYLQRDPLTYAYRTAKALNISIDSTQSIVEGMQKVDVATLVKKSDDPAILDYKSNLEAGPFFPIIEVDHPDAVITKAPYEILENGDYNKNIPYIYSHNSGEMSLPYMILEHSNRNISEYNTNPLLFVSESFNNPPNKEEIGRKIQKYFLGNSSAEDNIRFGNFLEQEVLTRGIRKEVDMKRRFKEAYFAIISYEGTVTSDTPGTGHAEEVKEYLFFLPDHLANHSASDILIRKRMVKMWTNFAKYGNPTPSNDALFEGISWPQTESTGDVTYLEIDKELKIKQNPYQEDYEFWNMMLEDNAVKPYVTY